MLRRGLLALVALTFVGLAACDPIEVIPDPVITGNTDQVWDVKPGPQTLVEGVPWTLTMTATDVDGDAIEYLLKQKPDSTMQINPSTGEMTWTPAFTAAADCKGKTGFTVQVTSRTKPGGAIVDVDHLFDLVVLNDLDEDGLSDVDNTNAVVDPDIDGDTVTNAAETALGTDECVADSDDDGVKDGVDNCPVLKNPLEDCDSDPLTPTEQCDSDDDGRGNICDVCPSCALDDPDDDGVCNCEDNCPEHKNPKEDCDSLSATPVEQCDDDHDGIGNVCDGCPNDTINDPDQDDKCAFAADGVTVTDNCNGDTDGDGVITAADQPATHINQDQADRDSDDIGDVCDACPDDATNDGDQDGVCEDVDNCPGVKNDDQADMDGDTVGDLCDDNIDGDCKLNVADNCPSVDNCDQVDTDNDGEGDACDSDDDDDTILDVNDNCPLVANVNQVDVDGDLVGFQCDPYVVIPAALHMSGAAAQRVSGYSASGAVALAFESRETSCANAVVCPTPGVLVVDAADRLYAKRFATGDADSAWLDIPFGAGGELGEPFVNQAGVAYFGTEKGGSYDVRRINGTAANTQFATSIVTSAARFRNLPDATTALEVRLGTGNPGQYRLEDLSGPGGEPRVLKTAAGSTGPPALGPFEIACGRGGCKTTTADNGATKMGAFYGLDSVLYMPFVAATGEVEVLAYTGTSGGFQTLNVPTSPTATTPLKATDLRFLAEDVNDGTPWYCMRKTGAGASLVHASGGVVVKAASTAYFYACDTLQFAQSPSGVWFIIGQGASTTDATMRRLSFFDPNGTLNTATDIIGGLGTKDELTLHFAGATTYVQKRRSDGQAAQPEMVSTFEYWPPGSASTTPIGGADLYDALATVESGGWLGVIGRDVASYTDTERIIARRYKPGVTTVGTAETTLRTDNSTGTLTQKPLRAWVSPEGDVWAFLTPPSGANVLTVYPSIGPAPANTGLATSTLVDGARVTFHPAGTLVGIRTNTFQGKLQFATKNAAGITLTDFSPAVQIGGGVQSEFLKPGLTTGAPNNWVAYPSYGTTTATVIAEFEVGNPPMMMVEATGLVALPFGARVGADLQPWFMFETASGFSVATVKPGALEVFATNVVATQFINQQIGGRSSFWGVMVQRQDAGAIYVCRLPTLPPLPADVGCWVAVDAGVSSFPPAWGPFVDNDGVARAVSVVGETEPVVTLWQSVEPAVPYTELP